MTETVHPFCLCQRELGLGEIPTQENGGISLLSGRPNVLQVGSVVSRVKGTHHHWWCNELDGFFCRQIRWYREPIRPVVADGFF